ncbi:MAG TPA: glycosyltransferase [Solirubrobacteraceae bacterium]|nr:glycosyltransferase [Solirubrobacteraceae bacterium]
MSTETVILVAARDEAQRIGATIAALARAFPAARVWVADDGSRDATAEIARGADARVVSREGPPSRRRAAGKGQAMSAAARAALADVGEVDCLFVLCDGDLSESAARLGPLAEAVRSGRADIAVAVFARPAGGGFGIAVGFARWAIRRRCGLRTRAPISGQRAMRGETLRELLPFAPGYGMEMGMTIDAVCARHRVLEIDLDLAHRATGRTLAGFLHRARQLVDFVRVYASSR